MLGVIIFTSTAFIIGLIISITNYYLNRVDKRVEEVLALLPGYNCGACGFGGCPGMAHNIVYNKVDPHRCKAIKDDQYEKLKTYLQGKDLIK